MALHRLTRITMGVPNVADTASYYTDFGLRPVSGDNTGRVLATVEGGEQLRIVATPRRRLVELGVGADDPDDLDRVSAGLTALGAAFERTPTSVAAIDCGTEIAVRVEVTPRLEQVPTPVPAYNSPGLIARPNTRAPGILRTDAVRPRRLGHVVVGSVDEPSSQEFFRAGIGFKVSDTVPGLATFLRCSTDHHNILIQQAPLQFLHHTAWQVDDVDEVGRGATAMLKADPRRHVWGLGRHHVGGNFFWYLRDPAGHYSEYYSDLDCIVDDALWKPQVWEAAYGLYNWGPEPPPSFVDPEDLAAMMTGAHATPSH